MKVGCFADFFAIVCHSCMKLLKTKQVCKQSIEYRKQITVVGSFMVHSVLFLVKCFVWLEVSYATVNKDGTQDSYSRVATPFIL